MEGGTRERTYLCIDLKTFYASVECADRGLDPLTTNLVVADRERGRSTICLAVSPAMKRLGVRNRCRVFEIPQGIDYIMATPRMRHYMEVSAEIYGIYLEFVSAQDVHVYSIDECFIDATPYLGHEYGTGRDLAETLMEAVYARCGILATAGIGPNLFLAKVALDISAKHSGDGIGELDEEGFRATIWRHRPITDIWGIGPGIAARLASYGAFDLMGVAALDERILYREFGVQAEYLIDHARGVEPCTIADIHAYRPEASSITSGQVLARNYSYEGAYTVLREMVDALVLDLVSRHAVCDGISLYVGYGTDRRDLARLGASGTAQYRDDCGRMHLSTDGLLPRRAEAPGGARSAGGPPARGLRPDAGREAGRPAGEPAPDLPPRAASPGNRKGGPRRTGGGAQAREGRRARGGDLFIGEHGARSAGGRGAYGHAGASRKLGERTNSFKRLMERFDALYAEIVDPTRPIKRINIGFSGLLPEEFATYDLFRDEAAERAERDLADTMIAVRDRYGKNALLRGTSFRESATGRERNQQVGGHRA